MTISGGENFRGNFLNFLQVLHFLSLSGF